MTQEEDQRTTIAIKRKTRTKLDELGFDRHEPYDLVINKLIERYQYWQPEMEKLDWFYLRFNEIVKEHLHKMITEIQGMLQELPEANLTAKQHVEEKIKQLESPPPKDIHKVVSESVKSYLQKKAGEPEHAKDVGKIISTSHKEDVRKKH